MKLRQIFSRLTKKTKFLIAGGLTLAALVPAVAIAGYGPNGADRVIYDFKNPAQREGAFDGPRFNSYINTNVYGDERAFVDAKECTTNGADCYKQGEAAGYNDQQPVVVGKEYIIRAYVHNIANPSINDNPETATPMDGIGVAKNTHIRFELPNTEGVANGFTAQARITADNAMPKQVYDTVDLRNNDEKFNVSYVPGSAYIFNASHPAGLNLSDDIMSTQGTLIGNDKMDGNYGGCFEYSAFVVIRVKVTAPDVQIEKLVSKVEMPKMTDTAETIDVKRGDTVSWRLNYENKGSLFADDVVVRDPLPKGLEIVPGSVQLTTSAGTQTLQDDALEQGGQTVGDYAPTGNGVIRFSTKVNTDPEVCELTNIAFVKAGNNANEDSDSAKIKITDCNPTKPVYVCDNLTVTLVRNRTYKFEAHATGKNGAKVKSYEYTFGDNSSVLATDKSSVEHTYAKDGTYSSNVKVVFDVDGKLVIVGGDGECAKTLKITTDKPMCEIPGKEHLPKDSPECTLPKTGAGNIAGLMAAVTATGAVAHRRFTLRKNR